MMKSLVVHFVAPNLLLGVNRFLSPINLLRLLPALCFQFFILAPPTPVKLEHITPKSSQTESLTIPSVVMSF